MIVWERLSGTEAALPKGTSMNADLRRRTDEVVSRLTHLRDSL
jgi:hypothetical protein